MLMLCGFYVYKNKFFFPSNEEKKGRKCRTGGKEGREGGKGRKVCTFYLVIMLMLHGF